MAGVAMATALSAWMPGASAGSQPVGSALRSAGLATEAAPPPPAPATRRAAPTHPAARRPSLTVVWGGDVMLGRRVADGMRRSGGSDPLAALGRHLARADFRVVNLEGPLTRATRTSANPHDLTADPGAVRVLAAAGVDVVSLANNHATDNGPAGLAETLAVLDGAGIRAVGAGVGVAASAPVILEKGGLRLALVAFDATGGGRPASGTDAGVAAYDPSTARIAIARARAAADVVAVLVHWGVEHAPRPSAAQRAVAGELAAAGADLVVGHHPHVVQPLAWQPRPGRRPALVAFSLGNLVFDGPTPDARRGVVLETRIDAQGVATWSATPVAVDGTGTRPLDDAPARRWVRRRLDPAATGR